MADLATERKHVGEGWQQLIDQIDERVRDVVGDYQVLQIKEKFGGLRFYIDLGESSEDVVSEVFNIVHTAEAKSFEICEECGEPGECKASLTGWMKTLCPTHWDERDDYDKKWREEHKDV